MVDKLEVIVVVLAIVLLLLAALGVGWYKAGIEQSTFNRLTGHDVTQWEALWTNLRVDCN